MSEDLTDEYLKQESSEQKKSSLLKELEAIINVHSLENESGTPDFILASYLKDCLDAYNRAVIARDTWLGVIK